MPRSMNTHKRLPPPDPYPDDDEDEAPRIHRPRTVHDRGVFDSLGRAVSSPVFDSAQADPWLPEADDGAAEDDMPAAPPGRRRH